MTALSARLLVLECTICFAPISVMVLLGWIMVPFWLHTMIGDEASLYAGIPALLVLAGSLGLYGLFVVVRALAAERPALRHSRTTVLLFVALGTSALLYGAPDSFLYDGLHEDISYQHVGIVTLTFTLPLMAAAHVLFLARKLLFFNNPDD